MLSEKNYFAAQSHVLQYYLGLGFNFLIVYYKQ